MLQHHPKKIFWIPLAAFIVAWIVTPVWSSPVAIMPLGDSITHGGDVPGGYRSQLFADLTNARANFLFVGSTTDNPTAVLTTAGQTHHEGHCGYRIDQIDGNLDASLPVYINGDSGYNGGYWLSGTSSRSAIYPNVVLLELGINDIGSGASAATAYNRLDNLVGHILRDRPSAAIIVASLVPNASSSKETVLEQYNALLPNIASKYSSTGSKVYFLDMHSVIGVSELVDGTHPTKAGYDKMGNAWFNALESNGLLVPEPPAAIMLLVGGSLLLCYTMRRRYPSLRCERPCDFSDRYVSSATGA